jgi:hypothetical protein
MSEAERLRCNGIDINGLNLCDREASRKWDSIDGSTRSQHRMRLALKSRDNTGIGRNARYVKRCS